MPRVKKKDKAEGSKEAEDADESFADCEEFWKDFNEDSEEEVMSGTGQDEIEEEESALGGAMPGPMKKRRARTAKARARKAKARPKPKAKLCKAKARPKTRVRITKKGNQKAKAGAKKTSRAPRLPAGVSLLCMVYLGHSL